MQILKLKSNSFYVYTDRKNKLKTQTNSSKELISRAIAILKPNIISIES